MASRRLLRRRRRTTVRHGLPTTCCALLAIGFALVLVAHDAVMATGPHARDHAGHAAHVGCGDEMPGDTACDELVAVRTTDTGSQLDLAGVSGQVEAVLPVPAMAPAGSSGKGAVDPPAPPRAMLQTWRN